MTNKPLIHVIGGGLAGSEAAFSAASQGVAVRLYEMRPVQKTDAHETSRLAEMVCSNSFRSDDHEMNAVGLLHEEMRRAGSLIMASADLNKVPAGSALAVDRDEFAATVEARLEGHPLVEIVREEVEGLPPEEWENVIIATGPLTSPAMSKALADLTDEDELAFFDAIAPIIYTDSIDFEKAWYQSRYDKAGPGGTGKDYINLPLDEDQYRTFIQDLVEGEKGDFREWEKTTPYFDGCLPIEIMAERGPETLRFGPMKPVGLTNPHQPDIKAYAVVQLRQDNALATLYNMVGFQTKLTYGEQQRIFKKIPGLENARFARLGGLHRNTFLNSPKLLDTNLRLIRQPRIRFAGQITGVEGYVESAAMGLLAGRFAAANAMGEELAPPPPTTAMGALIGHISGGHILEGKAAFQPMNVNFGLFPPIEIVKPEGVRIRGKEKGRLKKKATTARALVDFEAWLEG
jgi:methylenetetrahydrofolate--tRNA-(uracil-5-)-methyltransferase